MGAEPFGHPIFGILEQTGTRVPDGLQKRKSGLKKIWAERRATPTDNQAS